MREEKVLACFENILSHLSVKNKVWNCQNLFVVDFSSKKEHFLINFGFQPVQLLNVDCPVVCRARAFAKPNQIH